MGEGWSIVVVGAQWGDEGKGKIVDLYAADADVIMRYGGGANAGHTIWVNGVKTVLHLLPSSITRSGKINMVGPYVVVDPEVLVAELEIARRAGATVLLDPRCQVVTPLHKQIDALREGASGSGAIGTTQKGISPTYEDRVARRGPRLGDIVDPAQFARALQTRNFLFERSAVVRAFGGTPMTAAELQDWIAPFAEPIGRHLSDLVIEHGARTSCRSVYEGAQAIMLDIEAGTWPYVTGSVTGPAAVGFSVGVYRPDRVIGIAKAYATRVGGGPFPTETAEQGDWLRERGGEYGATTGRPRRCGWLDLPALTYAIRMGGITELVITKLDVLRGLAEIPVCIAYRDNGKPIESSRPFLDSLLLGKVQPVFQMLPGWDEDISGCRSWDELPETVQAFLNLVSIRLGLPVTGASVGPDREQMVWR